MDSELARTQLLCTEHFGGPAGRPIGRSVVGRSTLDHSWHASREEARSEHGGRYFEGCEMVMTNLPPDKFSRTRFLYVSVSVCVCVPSDATIAACLRDQGRFAQ